MATEKIPMTLSGFTRLQVELKKLKTVDRVAVIQAIGEARSHGDLKENAEFHAAREKQGFIEDRIAKIDDLISRANVIDISKLTGPTIKFGAIVTLLVLETNKKITYQLLGEEESDFNKNQISINAPLSKALIKKQKGDNVEVSTPAGLKSYEILSVEYK